MTASTEAKLAGAILGVSDEAKAALEADLNPDRIKRKPGAGNLSYLATHDVIRTANRIFGYGRWGYEVVAHELIGSAQMKNGKGEDGWYTAYRCTVKLTVAGCLPVSGVGYGDAFEKQWSGQLTTHELACKEAESDALKRALRNYGDQFGLILYAKDDEKRRIEGEKETEAAKQETGQGADATKALPTGDRVVTDDEVEAFIDIAKNLGQEQWAVDKLVEVRKKNADGGFGHVVNLLWYKPVFQKLVQKAAEQGVGTTEDPAGDAAAESEADKQQAIEQAFAEDTKTAA